MVGIGSHVCVYRFAKTVDIRTVCGNSSSFEVKVGMHLG